MLTISIISHSSQLLIIRYIHNEEEEEEEEKTLSLSYALASSATSSKYIKKSYDDVDGEPKVKEESLGRV